MICDDARPLLDPLYDGALNSRDTAMVLEHLKTCVECGHEWHEMEQFKDRFRNARKRTDIPSTLNDRIVLALNKEDSASRALFMRRYMRTMPVWLIAASLLLVGLFAFPNIERRSGNETLATIDSLLDCSDRSFNGRPAGTRIVSMQELPEKVGFQPKFINMSGWNMERASLYERPSGTRMAKFDFASTKYGAPLYCFQSLEGEIVQTTTSPTESQNISGKRVRFGQRGRFQFALWSQNGRDYLIVTPLPKDTLTEIVANA